MSVKTYYENKKLSKHFNSKEFICPCCKFARIEDIIIDLLEKLFTYMNAYKIIITSGYRCNDYEMSLKGGVKNGFHTKGRAVDINVWKNDKERFSSKEICLALEDLGWNHGIGIISDTAVHIDNRTYKFYFDERKNCTSIGDSFYTYYNVKKQTELERAIIKLSDKGIIDKDFWLKNYNTQLGLKCIPELIIKFSIKID